MSKLASLLDNRLCIIFALDHYNPLGQIRSLGEAGIRPIFIAAERLTFLTQGKAGHVTELMSDNYCFCEINIR